MTREFAEKVASFCTGFCLSAIYWLGGMGLTFRIGDKSLFLHTMFALMISASLIVLLSLFFYCLLRFKFYKGWDGLFFNKMCILLNVLILIAVVRRLPSQNTLMAWLHYVYFFYCFILFPIEILLINYVFSKSLKTSLALYGCMVFVCFMTVWSPFLIRENSYFFTKNFWCKFFEIGFFVEMYFFYHIRLRWMKVVSIFLVIIFIYFLSPVGMRRQEFSYFFMVALVSFIYLVKLLYRKTLMVVLCVGLLFLYVIVAKRVNNPFEDRRVIRISNACFYAQKYFFKKMFGEGKLGRNYHNVFLDMREKVGFVGLLFYCSSMLYLILFCLNGKMFLGELFIISLGNGILMLGNSSLSRFVSLYVFLFFVKKRVCYRTCIQVSK